MRVRAPADPHTFMGGDDSPLFRADENSVRGPSFVERGPSLGQSGTSFPEAGTSYPENGTSLLATRAEMGKEDGEPFSAFPVDDVREKCVPGRQLSMHLSVVW